MKRVFTNGTQARLRARKVGGWFWRGEPTVSEPRNERAAYACLGLPEQNPGRLRLSPAKQRRVPLSCRLRNNLTRASTPPTPCHSCPRLSLFAASFEGPSIAQPLIKLTCSTMVCSELGLYTRIICLPHRMCSQRTASFRACIAARLRDAEFMIRARQLKTNIYARILISGRSNTPDFAGEVDSHFAKANPATFLSCKNGRTCEALQLLPNLGSLRFLQTITVLRCLPCY